MDVAPNITELNELKKILDDLTGTYILNILYINIIFAYNVIFKSY